MLQHLRGQIAAHQPPPPAEVRVWPENWHAAQVFVAMNTQWRTRDMADGRLRYEGLRYEALGPVLAELAHIALARPHSILMRQLRYLEQRALTFVNQ